MQEQKRSRLDDRAIGAKIGLIIIDGRRWSLLLMLLSMDTFLAACSSMGLPLPEVTVWRPWIRAQVLHDFERQKTGARHPSRFVPETLAAMVSAFGDRAVTALLMWGRTTFCETEQEHCALEAWSRLLDRCNIDDKNWVSLGFPSDWADFARREYRRARSHDLLDALSLQLSSERMSDWDLAVCSLRGLDMLTGKSKGFDGIVEYVQRSTMARQLLEFWRMIYRRMDAKVESDLHTNATKLLLKLMPEVSELPPPRVLHIPDPLDG